MYLLSSSIIYIEAFDEPATVTSIGKDTSTILMSKRSVPSIISSSITVIGNETKRNPAGTITRM